MNDRLPQLEYFRSIPAKRSIGRRWHVIRSTAMGITILFGFIGGGHGVAPVATALYTDLPGVHHLMLVMWCGLGLLAGSCISLPARIVEAALQVAGAMVVFIAWLGIVYLYDDPRAYLLSIGTSLPFFVLFGWSIISSIHRIYTSRMPAQNELEAFMSNR